MNKLTVCTIHVYVQDLQVYFLTGNANIPTTLEAYYPSTRKSNGNCGIDRSHAHVQIRIYLRFSTAIVRNPRRYWE